MIRVVVIMGVSGCGKSTIGTALAQQLNQPFFEGDDYHPAKNISKMSAGIPLTNTDRAPWIEAICLAIKTKNQDAVLACSALNEDVRNRLQSGLAGMAVMFICLTGSMDVIQRRLAARAGHFMDPGLIQSQFDALDIPEDAIEISVDQSQETVINTALAALG